MYKSTLNLANINNSQIKYKISSFPDGQQTIDITSHFTYDIWSLKTIEIISRLNSFKDLELIICATQAIRNIINDIKINLFVPYFLGARSDRKFQEGGVNYLKQVICPIINSQNFNKVTVIDPHSDVLEACLNNFSKINNFDLIGFSLEKINNKDNIILVSPDAGAYKKIFDVAKEFGINRIITATKVRDLVTGNILRTEIPGLDQHNNSTYVIVDDIGDGFGTFIQLAKVLKEGRPTTKVYLVVTHSIQENGLKNALECIDGIFTTNSINEWNIENVKVLNVF